MPFLLKAQTPPEVWKNMGDFNKHRVVSTAIAWTGTIVFCKATGDNQVKGALYGGLLSLGIGAGKELVWDKAMHRGTPSFKDFGADALGTAVGTMAGIMCNGIAQHFRDRKEELMNEKRYNPLE